MVIWLTDTGKEGLFGADGKPLAAVAALLGKGYGIATLDMFGQGEFVAAGGGKALASVRLAPPGADRDSFLRAACFTFGYNPPLLAQRVHDVMSLAEFLRQGEGGRVAARIHLVAVGQQAGPVGLAARFMLGDWIHRAAIDTRGFDFRAVERFDDPMFLPGILRYGGLGALWSLNQPLATVSIRGAEDVSGAIAAALR